MEVRRIEQILFLSLQPRSCEPALATRTMPVATAAKHALHGPAIIATILGPAEFLRATTGKRSQDACFFGGYGLSREMWFEKRVQQVPEFAAHVAVGGTTLVSNSSGLTIRSSRPAVTWR